MKAKSRSFEFRLLVVNGDFHMLGKFPGYAELINNFVGKPVIEVCGHGIGVNLKLIDKEAWSEYISQHVAGPDENMHCVLTLPEGPPTKRED
jgi:hypothetical protein